MKLVSRFIDFSSRVQNVTVIRAIRNGLVNMIPILIIGAFALVFKFFPVAAYQTFIAEFVETEEDKELLHQMGCDIYQGYLYSPAKPVEQPKAALAS